MADSEASRTGVEELRTRTGVEQEPSCCESCGTPAEEIGRGTQEAAGIAQRRGLQRIQAFFTGGIRLIPAAVALVVLVGGWLPAASDIVLSVGAYLLGGWDVVWRAARNSVRGSIFDEQFLMTVATLGAFAIGAYHEAVAVMLFYQFGELLQGRAVAQSRGSIAALLRLRPDRLRVERAGELELVAPEELLPGEMVVLRPGERLGVDGTVESGQAWLDTSAMTGEPMPRKAEPGTEVNGGSVNTSGELRIRVTTPYQESTVARVLRLVEEAYERKSHTEQFITRFARVYTPAVVGIAALVAVLPPLLVPAAAFAEWIHRALVFLVVSCPCALVVSVPLSFFAGIGSASRTGVLSKGAQLLERLKGATTVVFDKTGTLTEGRFAVRAVKPAGAHTVNANGEEMPEAAAALLRAAAGVEKHSNHPVAQGIVAAARSGGVTGEETAAEEFTERSGYGVSGIVDGRRVVVGKRAYLDELGIGIGDGAAGSDSAATSARRDASDPTEIVVGTAVYCAIDGAFAGTIYVGDALKSDAADAVYGLRAAGVNRIIMLTGDNQRDAHAVAALCGIGEVQSELLPEDKVRAVQALREEAPDGTVVFVGDGMNDAPVLAAADVGVAMGGLGSDAAVEAADIVLATDQPARLRDAMLISRRTSRIVWQNIVLALGAKAAVLLAGAFGMVSMWAAVIADVGVTLVAVANALRILRRRSWC
jgi:Cd2+/Zn2+-exporting ATPase